MTHYIPAFTHTNGDKQQAVCGVYIRLDDHGTEPTCPVCAAWLSAAPVRDADDDATAQALEAEFPELAGRLRGR